MLLFRKLTVKRQFSLKSQIKIGPYGIYTGLHIEKEFLTPIFDCTLHLGETALTIGTERVL
jgi:hypothetical protein